MRRPKEFREFLMGLSGAIVSLVVLAVWIPLDVDTGIMDRWRQSTRVGDALMPTLAAGGILLASVAIALRAWISPAKGAQRDFDFGFFFGLCSVLSLGCCVIVCTGPVLSALYFGDAAAYRQNMMEMPWKYCGFVMGGSVTVLGLMALSQRRVTWSMVSVAAAATLMIALFFDLSFHAVWLPPLGDL